MSNFFPAPRCNFACTDRQPRHVARTNGRCRLKAPYAPAALARDGTSRDRRVCARARRDFLRRRMHLRGDDVARTTTGRNEMCQRTVSVFRCRRGSRRHDSTTLAVQREIGISARQRIPSTGPFTTGTSGTRVLSFG